MAGFAIMAANFISKDEVSQNIVNEFLQRRLQYIITSLKKLEIATARHRANMEAAVTDSATNDEYSVHGYIKGAYVVPYSPLHYLKREVAALFFSFFLFF
jgi:predicted metal-dependent hydrolase